MLVPGHQHSPPRAVPPGPAAGAPRAVAPDGKCGGGRDWRHVLCVSRYPLLLRADRHESAFPQDIAGSRSTRAASWRSPHDWRTGHPAHSARAPDGVRTSLLILSASVEHVKHDVYGLETIIPSHHHAWRYHEHSVIQFVTDYPIAGKPFPLDAGNPCAAGRCRGLPPERHRQMAAVGR